MRRDRINRSTTGFTLVELLAVIVIISVLAGVVLYVTATPTDDARVVATKLQIGELCNAIQKFRMDQSAYPESLQDLVQRPSSITESKWPKGGYWSGKLPKDSWGNDFVYINPGTRNPNSYDLISYGADGREGGADYDADIFNGQSDEK